MLQVLINARYNFSSSSVPAQKCFISSDFQALIDHLKPKMDANVAVLASCKVGSRAHMSAVVSSLAIIIVVERYKINLKRKDLTLLLSCLVLEADPEEKKCSVYEAVLAEFSASLRE